MNTKTKKEWTISVGFLLLSWGIILSTYQALGYNSYLVYFAGIITLIGAALLGRGFVLNN